MKYIHTEMEEARSMKQLFSQTHLFEIALEKALQEGSDLTNQHDLLAAVANHCYDLGIVEDAAQHYATNRFRYIFKDIESSGEAALIVSNTYAMKRGGFAACKSMSKAQRMLFLLNDFLQRNYKLRYNVMKRQTEYADLRNTYPVFQPLTDREIFHIKERAVLAGIVFYDSEIRNRLTSKAIRDYCPMEDFLLRLPKWDKKKRIHRLAKSIPTDNKDWPERFYRWFLSMVAHWLTPDTRFANAIIPVLVGPQGCGKSQWIRSLLPEEMQDYYHDGFDLRRRAEAEQMMARYGLINIDEFDAISPRQEPVLKHLVQLTEVKTDGQVARRFCSFIATSNHHNLHRDTSGSRRYIFVDVKENIKLNHRLSLQQIYAEAVEAVGKNERTYFTKNEERKMQETNEEFREQDIIEQLFLQYYEPLPTQETVEGGEWLSAIEIYRDLEKIAKKDLGITRANKFGGILLKHCGKQGAKYIHGTRLYNVRKK